MAAELGFEPRLNESESFVLPLHNSASNEPYFSMILFVCQAFLSGFLKKLQVFQSILRRLLFSRLFIPTDANAQTSSFMLHGNRELLFVFQSALFNDTI